MATGAGLGLRAALRISLANSVLERGWRCPGWAVLSATKSPYLPLDPVMAGEPDRALKLRLNLKQPGRQGQGNTEAYYEKRRLDGGYLA